MSNEQLQQELKEKVKEGIKPSDLKKKKVKVMTNNQDASKIIERLEQEKAKHNEQLRKINLLFDANAKNYQTIDFNRLYALLANIAERERESRKNDQREFLSKDQREQNSMSGSWKWK